MESSGPLYTSQKSCRGNQAHCKALSTRLPLLPGWAVNYACFQLFANRFYNGKQKTPILKNVVWKDVSNIFSFNKDTKIYFQNIKGWNCVIPFIFFSFNRNTQKVLCQFEKEEGQLWSQVGDGLKIKIMVPGPRGPNGTMIEIWKKIGSFENLPGTLFLSRAFVGSNKGSKIRLENYFFDSVET